MLSGIGVAADSQLGGCAEPGSSHVLDSPVLNVATINISHGRNTALNQLFVSTSKTYENVGRIAAFLDEIDADVVALQEADAESKWSGNFDHVRYIVDNSRHNCFFHGRHARGRLYSYGTALLARNRLSDSASFEFEPTPPTLTKGFVQATLDWSIDGEIYPVTVVSVHLDYSRKKVRDAQIEAMVAALSDLKTDLVVMGDFNSVWTDKRSHVKDFAERLGLTAYDPSATDLGTYKSPNGKRLDWILISSGLEFGEYRVLSTVVADHFAVFSQLRRTGK
jgi:endonuclease/exonuclease/phosphatase family metal-dependent hydrolase